MGRTGIKASLKDGYTVKNSTRSHNWIVDEPVEMEGADLGPKPTETLLSAIASCKLITMKMYANRKGWKIDDIEIGLVIAEVQEKTIIEKSLVIIGDLSDEQKQRLFEISMRCPVVKMLSNSLEFRLV